MTDKLWDRLPVAWLGTAAGATIAFVPFYLAIGRQPIPWLEYAGVAGGFAVAAPCFLWWYAAVRESRRFTAEMEARASELRRRIGDPEPVRDTFWRWLTRVCYMTKENVPWTKPSR